MKVFLYILQSQKDNGYYTGISNNPKRRLLQHNSKKTISIKHRVPFNLVISVPFNDYKEARRVEKILKKYTKAKIFRFINNARARIAKHYNSN